MHDVQIIRIDGYRTRPNVLGSWPNGPGLLGSKSERSCSWAEHSETKAERSETKARRSVTKGKHSVTWAKRS